MMALFVLPCEGRYDNYAACRHLDEFAKRMRSMQTDAAVDLEQKAHSLYKILPETKATIEINRSKPALDFIAAMGKSWFGFATNKDLVNSNRHINYLQSRQANMTNAIVHLQDQFATVTSSMNHRFHKTMKLFQTVQTEMEQLNSASSRSIMLTYNTTAHMIAVLTTKQNAMHHIQEAYLHLIVAAESLVTGSLSPFLVPPDILVSTLTHVGTVLGEQYPGFHVVHKQPNYYYNNPHYLYRRAGNSIYVTLKIPVATRQGMLTYYAIRVLPVRVNDTTTIATVLTGMPNYFAISMDGPYHTTFTDRDLSQCSGHALRHCPYEVPLSPITYTTCTYSLFTDSTTMIVQSCNFQVVAGLVQPDLRELSPGTILITNTSRLILRCPGVPQRHVQGCNYCTLKLPCKCSLQSDMHFISPRIIACDNATSHITKWYPINLPLLRAIYGPDAYDNIGGEVVWARPTQPKTPDFHVYQRLIDDGVAADSQAAWDLNDAAKRAVNKQLHYSSPSDQLFHHSLDTSSDDYTTKIVGLVLTIITSLSIAVVVYLALYVCQVNSTLAAIIGATAQLPAKSDAVHINPYIPPIPPTHISPTPPVQQPDVQFATFLLYLIVLLASLATFIMGMLLVKWFRRHILNRWHSIFIIEISDVRSCVQIPVFNLLECPLCWQLSMPNTFITHVQIRAMCSRWYTLSGLVLEAIKFVPNPHLLVCLPFPYRFLLHGN